MSSGDSWLVKLRRYDGSESVISSRMTKESAQKMADSFNLDNQTDSWYIEQYDASKIEWPPYDDLSLIDHMD